MNIDNHIQFKELVNKILAEEDKYHLTRTAIIKVAKEVYDQGVAEGESMFKILQERLREVYKERRVDSIIDTLVNEKFILETQKEYARQIAIDEIERHLATPHAGNYEELLLQDKQQIMEDITARLKVESELVAKDPQQREVELALDSKYKVHSEDKEASIGFKADVKNAIRNIRKRYTGGSYGGFFCRPSAMEKKMQRFCEQIVHFMESEHCKTSEDLNKFITKNMARSRTFRKEWAKENMPDIFQAVSVEEAKREWAEKRKKSAHSSLTAKPR